MNVEERFVVQSGRARRQLGSISNASSSDHHFAMRWVSAICGAIVALAPIVARADDSESRPSSQPATSRRATTGSSTLTYVGMGLTIGGVALAGLGTYFVVRGNAEDDASFKTPAIVSYAVGGSAILIGVPMWVLTGPSENGTRRTRDRTLIVMAGPNQIAIRAEL